jgi:hypothetical protein
VRPVSAQNPSSDESVSRDLERAEEYEVTVAGGSVLGANKYQISTGIIIAARYADKLRRVALVALGKYIPKDVIIRDIAQLNKDLYHEIVEKRKLGKLDLVRITVTLHYDENEKRLVFDDIKISAFVNEDECKQAYEKELEDLRRQVQELSEENNKLKESLNKIKEIIQA